MRGRSFRAGCVGRRRQANLSSGVILTWQSVSAAKEKAWRSAKSRSARGEKRAVRKALKVVSVYKGKTAALEDLESAFLPLDVVGGRVTGRRSVFGKLKRYLHSSWGGWLPSSQDRLKNCSLCQKNRRPVDRKNCVCASAQAKDRL